MSVHVDDVFMAGNLEVLKNTKDKIKKQFNIHDSRKVKKFVKVYYEWGRDAKYTYEKLTMEKYVNKMV